MRDPQQPRRHKETRQSINDCLEENSAIMVDEVDGMGTEQLDSGNEKDYSNY